MARECDIASFSFGVKGDAKNVKDAVGIFELFFDYPLMCTIVKYTNNYINHVKSKSKYQRKFKETSVDELKALFGFLILLGVSDTKPNCKYFK